ncbi:acyltransferase family protein [Escherichia coli]|uniref:acyltransferase family protein n=1 Tax=Escherichia coli TaxID=562 RepID=UPI0015E9323D|nr:acyltransferase [Escherichia coli]MCK2666918.1 acyltransferase [Escherichia coli]QML82603.1 acyltransferase [Escherichia coli]QML91708.1 acyltransferase [Escherichia coli]HAJ4486703.1 acyltransferase family protein [Escherichia coli]
MKKTTSEILKRENNNFDLLRIIAATAVIIYHSFAINPSWGIIDPTKILLTYVTTGGLAVKVFFFISGLLVTNSLIRNKSLLHFAISRAFRILPGLYAVVILPSLIIGPLLTKIPLSEYLASPLLAEYVFHNLIIDTKYFLPGVGFDNPYGFNGSIWTIRYEIYCYIVLALLYFVGVYKSKALSNIICIAIIFEPITSFKGLLFASSDNNAIYLLAPCFALGSLIAINQQSYKPSFWHPFALIILSLLFRNNEEFFALFICSAACLFSLRLSSCRWFVALKVKNDISYGVYLWGFPLQQVLSRYHELGPAIGILAPLLVTYVIALLSWRLIEKPAIRIGRKVYERLSTVSKNVENAEIEK